ncbi:MAG: ATP synthase F0 subunit C [Candidatus Latescibacteria bacterium]|jgi:F-type H+-transporting ATPase subunit c|nr:ATP synthase F0 subunit C [Candidatus Latescibacterota bacterium]MDP7235589.1 ATP synthase F0 subunit C [Candidatus Latescibacterota bacterium]
MLYYMGLALAIGIGLPIGVIGAGIGQGLATAFAVQGIARQPEAADRIQTIIIIGLVLIESLVIYSFLLAILLMGNLPTFEQILQLAQAGQ